MTMNEII